MNVCVLISCMHQPLHNHDIIQRTNVQTNCVVINQCDYECIEHIGFLNKKGIRCEAIFIYTKERGLSRSRNMAIKNANGDICLICDDDEYLYDNYSDIILDGYNQISEADLLTYDINGCSTPDDLASFRKLSLKNILQTSSVQITFRRESCLSHNVSFDEDMGSGSGNGAGEENKFLMDFRRHKLNIYHVNTEIGMLIENSDSQWFNGYNPKYFENHGWASRRILGSYLSLAYILYTVIFKYSIYKKDISMFRVAKSELIGWIKKHN